MPAARKPGEDGWLGGPGQDERPRPRLSWELRGSGWGAVCLVAGTTFVWGTPQLSCLRRVLTRTCLASQGGPDPLSPRQWVTMRRGPVTGETAEEAMWLPGTRFQRPPVRPCGCWGLGARLPPAALQCFSSKLPRSVWLGPAETGSGRSVCPPGPASNDTRSQLGPLQTLQPGEHDETAPV